MVNVEFTAPLALWFELICLDRYLGYYVIVYFRSVYMEDTHIECRIPGQLNQTLAPAIKGIAVITQTWIKLKVHVIWDGHMILLKIVSCDVQMTVWGNDVLNHSIVCCLWNQHIKSIQQIFLIGQNVRACILKFVVESYNQLLWSLLEEL